MVSKPCPGRQYNSVMHCLRGFLQQAVAAKEAARVPFHFGDLRSGWSELPAVRRHSHSLRHVSGGPNVLSAAHWSAWKEWKCGYSASALCPRCGMKNETYGHRIWRCPANDIFLQWLASNMRSPPRFDELPSCLARCAIAPANCALPPEDIILVQQYVIMVNQQGAAALSCHRAGKPPPTPAVNLAQFHVAQTRLRSLALPPTKKDKAQISISVPQTQYVVPSGYVAEIHLDGSYAEGDGGDSICAGFGIVVATAPNNAINKFCSPVVVDRRLHTYRGAGKLSNNTAELSGAIHALELAALLPPGNIKIGYDSECAKCTTTGERRARANARQAGHARRALAGLAASHVVEWVRVVSHTGRFLNEMADRLAYNGAQGSYQWPALTHIKESASATSTAPASATTSSSP